MHRTVAVLTLFATASANGQSPFDPTAYLQSEQVQQPDQLKQGEVTVKGVKYRVFTSAAGKLYVPAVSHLTKADVERSLCANQMPVLLETCGQSDAACMQRNRERMTSEVTVVRAEAPLSDNTKAYAEVIGTTIKKKCGDLAPTYGLPLSWKPEFGIEYKDIHQRDPATYKIYTPGFTPQVGFKSEF